MIHISKSEIVSVEEFLRKINPNKVVSVLNDTYYEGFHGYLITNKWKIYFDCSDLILEISYCKNLEKTSIIIGDISDYTYCISEDTINDIIKKLVRKCKLGTHNEVTNDFLNKCLK